MKKLREIAAGLAVLAGAGGVFGAREMGKSEKPAAVGEAEAGESQEKPHLTVSEEGFYEHQADLNKINSLVDSVDAIDIENAGNVGEAVSTLLFKDAQLTVSDSDSEVQKFAENGRKLVQEKLKKVVFSSDKWLSGSNGEEVLKKLLEVVPAQTFKDASLLNENLKLSLEKLKKKSEAI